MSSKGWRRPTVAAVNGGHIIPDDALCPDCLGYGTEMISMLVSGRRQTSLKPCETCNGRGVKAFPPKEFEKDGSL